MKSYVVGGDVVVGGEVHAGATVAIEDGLITDVDTRGARPEAGAALIDASGCWVIPGIINAHAHGCTTGPLFSSAAPSLSGEQVLANLDRHLRAGVTTLVNVCGFALLDEVPDHVIDIRLGTTHLPSAFTAAGIVDGSGLSARSRAMTADRMIEEGTIALAEIGSGATLGGGVAAYRYVPGAVFVATGIEVDPSTATSLIDALVGPTRIDGPFDDAFTAAVREAGLPTSVLAPAREAILQRASAPVRASLASFAESVAVAERLGVPAMFHTAAPSVPELLRLARRSDATLVAGHMNHPTFGVDAAVSHAQDLREAGVVIDVSSLDVVHARNLCTPEVADALMSADVVDTLSTDYAGGGWEPMLDLAQRWIDMGSLRLERAVQLLAERPARVFGLSDRGLIRPGKRADIVLTRQGDLADVRSVIIGGTVAWGAGSGA